MRFYVSTLALLLFCSSLAHAQQTTLPLWPHATPEPAQTTAPEADVTKPTDPLLHGQHSVSLVNVTVPTLSVYPPHHNNTGTAALVFPGGGYVHLALTKEGTETCEWLNSIGITCLLVKYRIPEPVHYPDNPADLEDAQQAMRLARAHASEWHIDPTRIGVVGFSAGGNLATLLSTHPDDYHVESTPAAPDVNTKIDARPDFAILVYPAYLALDPDQTALDTAYTPNDFTPPTFITAAENDRTYGKNAGVYFRALLDARHPAELHYFATGGHGFGVHPANGPELWTALADSWLRSIGMLPALATAHDDGSSPSLPTPTQPCPAPPPPLPGQPAKPNPNASPADPNCF